MVTSRSRQFAVVVLLALVAAVAAVVAPSLADDNPPPICIGPCGVGPPPVPGKKQPAPGVKWSLFGSGESPSRPSSWTDNRILYARTPDRAVRWFPYIGRSDRRTLRHVNFSKYGVLAVFHVTTSATISLANVELRRPYGLSATLAVVPCCTGPYPPGPQPTRPPVLHTPYFLARIEKNSLPQPVRQLYINEVTKDP